jgi:hypothetical protein
VTTTRITHATPAALYAHTQNRDWEADSNIPDIFRNKGCNDIAYQLVNNDAAQRTNVIIKFYLEHELKLTGLLNFFFENDLFDVEKHLREFAYYGFNVLWHFSKKFALEILFYPLTRVIF